MSSLKCCLSSLNQRKLQPHMLEIVFYAFEGCKLGWFTTLQFSAGASCWILMVRLMRCTLCCVAARCGQKRWRNVASSVWAPVSPPRALEDSRSETGVWLEWRTWLPSPPNISRSHRRGYLHFTSGEKVSGERMKRANDPVEMALERYDGDRTGTLPVLIRYGQENMIGGDSRANKAEAHMLQGLGSVWRRENSDSSQQSWVHLSLSGEETKNLLNL